MNKPWLRFLILLIAIFLILLIAILSGYTEKKPEPIAPNRTQIIPTPSVSPQFNANITTIPFESIHQGDSYTAELKAPAIFVAGSADEANSFTGWLEANIAMEIQKVDFNTSLVVAVFRGKMGSSGYGINIESIHLTSGVVQIVVNLTDPPPNQAVSDVISYPYHIVLLPREKVRVAPGTTWAVYTPESTLLDQTRYP